MKKFIPFLSLALFMTACSSKSTETEVKSLQSAQKPALDTVGLAQFQQWKTQNELAPAAVPQQTSPTVAAPVKTVEIIREVRVVEKPVPVRRKVVVPQQSPVVTTPESPSSTETASTGNGPAENTNSGEVKTPAAGQETAKKEGWSKSAKGATIGAAGGAVIGAVINKRNPAVGAVIGGVLGAGVGYGIGKSKDKKDGRN